MEGRSDGANWSSITRAHIYTIASPGGITDKTIEALHGIVFIVTSFPPVALPTSRAATTARWRCHGCWSLAFWHFVVARSEQQIRLGGGIISAHNKGAW